MALFAVSLAALAARLASAVLVVIQPGYTDAYYYAATAARLAHGEGLTVDFVWNFLEAPHLEALPVPSHRFWMPLSTVLQAGGIVSVGNWLGTFRAAQLAIVTVAATLPAVGYAAARSIGGGPSGSLVAAALVGLGGLFAPSWVALDAFAPAALLGTAFFLLYAHAARGEARAGLAAGVAVGLLFLARAEGALFGLALLVLAFRARSRGAGIVGTAAALAIGSAWLARDLSLQPSVDLLSRSVLLVRYEQFFAVAPPEPAAFFDAWPLALEAKVQALWSNAAVALLAFMVILVPPLAAGVRAGWARSEVRAWALLLAIVYLTQSLVWTLHSTRGSFFHSLSAFLPFGIALAVRGAEVWTRRRDPLFRTTLALAALAGAAYISFTAMTAWDTAFNVPYRARAAAVDALPKERPFMAIDAAAWRWISGRDGVYVTPTTLAEARCVASRYGIGAVVLEQSHFAAFDALYGGSPEDWLSAPSEHGAIRIYRVQDPRDPRDPRGPPCEGAR